MNRILPILLLTFILISSCVRNPPQPQGTPRNVQSSGHTIGFTNDNQVIEAENVQSCTEYPYFDGKHRLSIRVEPTIQLEDSLITWFIFGSNPKVSAYFILVANEVNFAEIQTFEIPECPDPGGWILNFRTTYGGFTGSVSYCTYGYNRTRATYFDQETQKDLLFYYHSPYRDGNNSCTGPTGYITQPWCTGEMLITGRRNQSHASLFFFENEVAFCATQQNLSTLLNWQMNPTTPIDTFSVSFKTFPIAKMGIPNLTKVELSHYLHRFPTEGVDATMNYSVNGTHVYTESLVTGQVNLGVKMVSTGGCGFTK